MGIKTQRGTRNIHGHGSLPQLAVVVSHIVDFLDKYPVGKNPESHWMRKYFRSVYEDIQFKT